MPADKIAFSLPVNIFIKRSVTPENLLTNLIYANLKLKKQLEEYEALQKRVSKLLNELKVSFLESDIIFPQESDKKSSIYKERQSLEQKHQEITRKLKSLATLHGNENLSAIGSTKSPAFLHSKQKTSFDEDTSLLWIFNSLLSVVKYILSHKIEVFLLLFLTIMFIIVLLSMLRRRFK